jgi:transcription initiation factor TFIID subunit 13
MNFTANDCTSQFIPFPLPPTPPSADPHVLRGKTVSLILFGFGDVKQPLPETLRVCDEILTDFIQGVAFEANRVAHHAGRQKIKAEDFQFAFRRNPSFLGKIQEVFEKKNEIESARRIFKETEDDIVKDAAAQEAKGGPGAGAKRASSEAGRSRGGAGDAAGRVEVVEEETLGEQDDDVEAEADVLRKR